MGLLEYEGAFVFGTGLPSGVFRFAGHTVLGVYMSSASTAYNYVKNHAAIVQQPPFHPNTLYLSHLASKWVRTIFLSPSFYTSSILFFLLLFLCEF